MKKIFHIPTTTLLCLFLIQSSVYGMDNFAKVVCFTHKTNMDALLNPEGTKVITKGTQKTFAIFNAQTGQYSEEIGDDKNTFHRIVLINDNAILATGEKTIIYDLTGTSIGKNKIASDNAIFNYNSSKIILTRFRKNPLLWNIKKNKTFKLKLNYVPGLAEQIAISSDNKYISIGDYVFPQHITLWSTKDGSFIKNLTKIPVYTSSIVFTADNKHVIIASRASNDENNTLIIQNIESGNILKDLSSIHDKFIGKILSSPNNSRFISAQGNMFVMWNGSTYEPLYTITINPQEGTLDDFLFSPDNAILAVNIERRIHNDQEAGITIITDINGYSENTIILYDTNTGTKIGSIPATPAFYTTVFSRDNTKFLNFTKHTKDNIISCMPTVWSLR